MAIETGDFIQMLQLIILAITAEIFIAQFAIKLFQSSEATDKIKSAKGKEAINALRNGVQTTFISIFFFAISGTLLTAYLIVFSVPNETEFFMNFFESHKYHFAGGALLILVTVAVFIGGDTENPNKGIIGVVLGSFLTGVVSFFVIVVYGALLALTRSSEWIFFLSMISIACAMATFLFGTVSMAQSFVDVLDELYERT